MEPIVTAPVANEILSLVTNAVERSILADRIGLLNGRTHDGARDLYKIFGYKDKLEAGDFLFNYQRGDISKRIATAYPDATWGEPPEVLDDEDQEDETAFELAWKALAKKFKLWNYLRRADILSQLGRYSTLLLGVSGGSQVDQPIPNGAKVAYLMPYGESNCVIKTFETDPTNERFGKPLLYEFSIIDVTNNATPSVSNPQQASSRTITVHYSRVIHIAEGLLDNDVFGQSILGSIYNRLADLEKLVGGCAEVYWLNARGGINLAAEKDVTIADPEKVTQDANDYVNQLSRVLKTKGMKVETLELRTDSPKDQVDAVLSLISGATGIPKRILTGSESAELASSMDADNWTSRVQERRTNHCEPNQLRPLIDFFIATGDLPAPKNGEYIVKWPSLVSLPEDKKADIMVKKAQALAAYVNAPGADLLIVPKQFVEEILEMEYREDDILALEEEQAQQEADDAAALAEQMKASGLDPVTGKPPVDPNKVIKLPVPVKAGKFPAAKKT